MAVATNEQIAGIVNEVLKQWLDEGIEKATCVFDINTGPCELFANDVVVLIQERYPETPAEVEDYADWLALDGLESQSIHYYVRANGAVFDASRPEGVPTPDYLPTCRSIRICATSVDEDIDEEESTPAP